MSTQYPQASCSISLSYLHFKENLSEDFELSFKILNLFDSKHYEIGKKMVLESELGDWCHNLGT